MYFYNRSADMYVCNMYMSVCIHTLTDKCVHRHIYDKPDRKKEREKERKENKREKRERQKEKRKKESQDKTSYIYTHTHTHITYINVSRSTI